MVSTFREKLGALSPEMYQKPVGYLMIPHAGAPSSQLRTMLPSACHVAGVVLGARGIEQIDQTVDKEGQLELETK